jgi:enoyl-CoA hydratase/carnithine racemase
VADLEISMAGDHVQLWTINRPKHNSVGGSLLRELVEAAAAAREDDAVRAVVTTGAGPMYCSGADLDAMNDLDGRSLNGAFHHGYVGGDNGYASASPRIELLEELGIGQWVLDFLRLDKPLIAAVNGPAAGGGFSLALLHDLRVMAPTAFLATGFTSIGLGPEMGVSWLLPRLIGQSRATELLLLSPRITAELALEIGLAHRVAEDPVAEAVRMAEELASRSPAAISATVRLLRTSAGTSLPEQLSREWRFQQLLWETPEFQGAIAALIARSSSRG